MQRPVSRGSWGRIVVGVIVHDHEVIDEVIDYAVDHVLLCHEDGRYLAGFVGRLLCVRSTPTSQPQKYR